jgi:hypothetical protein
MPFIMLVFMPFVIIAFIAWGVAEDYMTDSIWKFIYYVLGFVFLIFGAILIVTMM